VSTPSPPLFAVEDLHVSSAEGVGILHGVDLVVLPGEVHALMGPNGSGKSTLASVLLGSPEYVVTKGSIRFKGDDITDWSADVRGKAGLFLAFQYPLEVAGVSVINFLRQALSAARASTSRCSNSGWRSWTGWTGSAWTRPSPTAT